ncbi:MAG: glycosyltransferase family 2 protein [Chloroflexi bacterium]|nr:glycosyltransferase family 2 protein [Chloroflexota bacterium]
MKNVSVVIIAFNEAAGIRECLGSVAWCDDIVVVDSGSTDGTPEICRQVTSKVFIRPWPGYSAQRNWAHQQARHPWIFILDADERVSSELRREIELLDPPDDVDGYTATCRNYLGGRWMRYGGLYPDFHLRLFRADKCTYAGQVHEQPAISGKVLPLRGDVIHYTYDDFADYLAKINRYTSLQAEEFQRAGTRPRWLLLKPFVYFVRAFVRDAGWRDGSFGLLYSAMIGLYPLVLYAKLWEKGQRR